MPIDITFRTQHALLLAGKQSEADGAPWNYTQVVKRPRQIDHHGRVDAVIFRARSQIPGIEMRANEHDLVRLLAATNFRDYILRLICGQGPVGNGKTDANIASLRQSREPLGVFARDYARGHGGIGCIERNGMPIE